MRGVFRTIAPGDAFILGVADNVMPTSIIERVERISDLVERARSVPGPTILRPRPSRADRLERPVEQLLPTVKEDPWPTTMD